MIAVIIPKIKITAYHISFIICDHFGKWIINRRLNDHVISLLCKCFDCHRKCKDNSRCFYKPTLFDFPVVVCLHPIADCIKIWSLHLTVSKDCLFCTFYQGIFYIRRSFKIHIRNPQWKHIFWQSFAFGKIIF